MVEGVHSIMHSGCKTRGKRILHLLYIWIEIILNDPWYIMLTNIDLVVNRVACYARTGYGIWTHRSC